MDRHSPTVGAMRRAHIAWTQRAGLSNGGNEILDLLAHMHNGGILDILRADDSISAWFVVMTIPLWFAALILHRYDV
jgi:hypothetical protein